MRNEKLRVAHLERRKASGVLFEDINFNLYEGEALGVLGLHEAGKSTLLNIIAGREPFDGGTVFLDEEMVKGNVMHQSARVALVKKRSALVGNLSVAENIFVLRRHRRFKLLVRKTLIEQQARQRLSDLGLNVDPSERASALTDIQSYMVEIIKAYILGARLILIDDFAKDYPADAYAQIGRVIENLKVKGVSFIVSGSQWASLCSFCDRIMILDRRRICKIVPATAQGRAVAERILLGGVGAEAFVKTAAKAVGIPLSVAFEAAHISGRYLRDLSFSVNSGEILALHDPRKRALDELYALLGDTSLPHTGAFSALGSEYVSGRGGLRAVTTDFNMEKRFINHMSLRDNLCMSCYPRMAEMGVLRNGRLRYVENEFVKWYGNEDLAGLKHCDKLHERDKIAVYLFTLKMSNPQLLFCADPGAVTDYAASQMIYRELRGMAQNGAAVLVMLSAMDQNGMADRVIKLPPYEYET